MESPLPQAPAAAPAPASDAIIPSKNDVIFPEAANDENWLLTSSSSSASSSNHPSKPHLGNVFLDHLVRHLPALSPKQLPSTAASIVSIVHARHGRFLVANSQNPNYYRELSSRHAQARVAQVLERRPPKKTKSNSKSTLLTPTSSQKHNSNNQKAERALSKTPTAGKTKPKTPKPGTKGTTKHNSLRIRCRLRRQVWRLTPPSTQSNNSNIWHPTAIYWIERVAQTQSLDELCNFDNEDNDNNNDDCNGSNNDNTTSNNTTTSPSSQSQRQQSLYIRKQLAQRLTAAVQAGHDPRSFCQRLVQHCGGGFLAARPEASIILPKQSQSKLAVPRKRSSAATGTSCSTTPANHATHHDASAPVAPTMPLAMTTPTAVAPSPQQHTASTPALPQHAALHSPQRAPVLTPTTTMVPTPSTSVPPILPATGATNQQPHVPLFSAPVAATSPLVQQQQWVEQPSLKSLATQQQQPQQNASLLASTNKHQHQQHSPCQPPPLDAGRTAQQQQPILPPHSPLALNTSAAATDKPHARLSPTGPSL